MWKTQYASMLPNFWLLLYFSKIPKVLKNSPNGENFDHIRSPWSQAGIKLLLRRFDFSGAITIKVAVFTPPPPPTKNSFHKK
jgi:hypothetical protein